MPSTDKNYLQKLFIDEAKPALNRHSGGGGDTFEQDRPMAYWFEYIAQTYNIGEIFIDHYWNDEECKVEFEIVYEEGCDTPEVPYPKGTHNVTDFSRFATPSSYAFGNGFPIKRFTGTLDMSNAILAESMFYSNLLISSSADLGNLIVGPNLTNCKYMFGECLLLESIPEFITSNVENFYGFCTNCYALKSVPPFDFSNAKDVTYAFSHCLSLQNIPELDLRNVTNTNQMVYYCRSLTSIRLKNLKVNTTIGSSNTYGHLITVDDLIFMINHLRNTGSSKTFTVGSANLTKLANVYVKVIDITDEMRAEDDLIDEKLPFVQCESTDEGAMLIKNYVSLKNWTLK